MKYITHLPFIIFHSFVTRRHHVLGHGEREAGAGPRQHTYTATVNQGILRSSLSTSDFIQVFSF